MKSNGKYVPELWIFLLTSTLLMVYLIIRAVYVPFTHDETSTFFHYVQMGKLWPGVTREDANNHFLNTVLTYISYQLFGQAKWVLRLPNLLFALVYFYFLYRIGLKLGDRVLRYGFWVVFCFSLYFVEFFAVSRGYGISMALIMGAIYYLIRAVETNKTGYHFLVAVITVLMLSANLTLIIPAIAFFVYQVFIILLQRHTINGRQWWPMAGFVIVDILVFFVVFKYMMALNSHDAFYIGTSNGFVQVTLLTLIRLVTGRESLTGLLIAGVLFLVMVLINLRLLIEQKETAFSRAGFVFLSILTFSMAGIVLTVHLFGVHYPEDRLAMYLFPLFFTGFFFTLDGIPENKFKPYAYIFLIPLVFFPVHFFSKMNLNYVNGYRTEAIPYRFFSKIRSEHIAGMAPPTVGGSNMRGMTWEDFNFRNGGKENMMDWAGYPDTLSDFQIVEMRDYPYAKGSYKKIDYAPYSGLTLLKRKRQTKLTKLVEYRDFIKNEPFQGEYLDLLNIKSDSLNGRTVFLDVDLGIFSREKPLTVWLVVQVVDSSQRSLIYKFIPFNWLRTNWDKNNGGFRQSLFVGPIPGKAREFKVYIWNPDKESFQLNKENLGFYETKP